MKILRRYILSEHIGPFIAALGVLTGLMLLNQLAKRFGDLIGKGLPWYVIAEVFGLSMPFIIAMTMPMAVLVAVLYSFQRLTGDNEITAFKAGGVSLVRLTIPVLMAATVLAATMVWFNDKVLPESNHALRQLLTDIGRKQPTFELRERVVNEVAPGKLFLQAARIDRMRSVLWDLTIFDLGRTNVNRTIYADSGHMAFNQAQTDLYLTLFDGSMHELDMQDASMDQRTDYSKQVIRVAGVTNELERGASASWRGDREMNIAMMRDEVVERHERLTQLQDSLNQFISTLAPIRSEPAAATPPGQEKKTTGDSSVVSGSDPGDSVSAEGSSTASPAELGAAARARAMRAHAIDVAGDEEEEDESRPIGLQEIRRRFVPQRSASWPPRGEPVAFAAQTRSHLERMASRISLQRREMNRYRVEIQKKYAIPVAAIVFVLIGAPVAVRFPRGGIGMVIGVSLTVFCVYYIFLIGGEDFADRGFMSPFWAMWAPNVLFTALGCGLLYAVTRGATRRRRVVPALSAALEALRGAVPIPRLFKSRGRG
jgi:lipopolysaccharide export system permease protein